MNIDQLLKRLKSMTKPETELMRQQRELGLMVVGEFQKDVDVVEAIAFAVVAADCKERVKRGEELPDDLTDMIFAAREHVVEALKPENIQIFRPDPA